MSVPIQLSSQNTTEAIQDSLLRCVQSYDTADLAMFNSSFTDDATFNLNGTVYRGLPAIRSGSFDMVSKLDTTHFITNVRVHFPGKGVGEGEGKEDEQAWMTASAMAKHYRTGEGVVEGAGSFTSGCLYDLEVVRDERDGLWRIKYWGLKIVWTEGDFGVMTGN